jgi:hypothetical protein
MGLPWGMGRLIQVLVAMGMVVAQNKVLFSANSEPQGNWREFRLKGRKMENSALANFC